MPYTPSRFDKGVTNRPKAHIFNMLPTPDLTRLHVYFNDFDSYVAADWTLTETQAGATQAISDGDGGLISLVNSAANNDINQIQKVGASFLMETGKQCWIKVRGQIDDATNGIFFAGLQVANVDGSATGTVTDGIFFLKPAASTTVQGYVRKAVATTNNVAIGTMANATMINLEAYYDGVATVLFGVNGVVTARMDVSSILPDTALAPIIGCKNGTAAARTAIYDMIYVAKER